MPRTFFRKERVHRAAEKRAGPEAVDGLIKALGSDDLRARLAAARALGEIGLGAKAAVPALNSTLEYIAARREAHNIARNLVGSPTDPALVQAEFEELDATESAVSEAIRKIEHRAGA